MPFSLGRAGEFVDDGFLWCVAGQNLVYCDSRQPFTRYTHKVGKGAVAEYYAAVVHDSEGWFADLLYQQPVRSRRASHAALAEVPCGFVAFYVFPGMPGRAQKFFCHDEHVFRFPQLGAESFDDLEGCFGWCRH
ncbi:hypothetical protein GCM10008942_07450 [Rhizomicrobium electricum]|uniref:Uncharacterized protein n=1 Tax=Rhizomicrobium electricum TaxID=480070 RepID=A0ABN1E8S1_9PROT